ncbi:MAG TPA: hypothetical protein VJ066_02760 [Candidatus Bathyarchaeia archaeon]|nr:hypothetical protein [Candidatus Bathyarchaeia archaeon]
MVSPSELEIVLRKTVLLYNRLKSPGVVAKLVKMTPETVTISFSGSFCYSCGVPIDLIKDFIQDLKVFSSNVDLAIGKTLETNPGRFEVEYKVKNN